MGNGVSAELARKSNGLEFKEGVHYRLLFKTGLYIYCFFLV